MVLWKYLIWEYYYYFFLLVSIIDFLMNVLKKNKAWYDDCHVESPFFIVSTATYKIYTKIFRNVVWNSIFIVSSRRSTFNCNLVWFKCKRTLWFWNWRWTEISTTKITFLAWESSATTVRKKIWNCLTSFFQNFNQMWCDFDVLIKVTIKRICYS